MTHSPDHAEREAILLAVYNKQPMTVFSEWMAEQLGLPLHAPIPLHVVEEKGGSVQPTRDIVNHTIDVMIALRGRDRMVEALEAKVAALEDRGGKAVIAYHVAICSPKGVVFDDDLYDAALATTIQAALDAGIPTRAALHDAKEADVLTQRTTPGIPQP